MITRTLSRRQFLPLATLTASRLFAQRPANRPNIIFILADDLGWGDVSCNNSKSRIPTPNIDRIANEGVRFTNAHTPSAVCSPTRYGLLTGRYPWRTAMREGVLYSFCPALIHKGRMTLGSMLQRQGYATGAFGKWHVGLDWTPVPGDPGDWEYGTPVRMTWKRLHARVDARKPFRNGPTDVGFDTFFGIADNTGFKVFLENDHVQEGTVFSNGVWSTPGFKRDEVDDLFTDRAIQFMEKNASKPFFVYLPLTAPHVPETPPKRLEGKSGDGRRGDMCMWVDENVGKVLATLDRLKLKEDTLIIFSSDNGAFFNGDRKTWTPVSEHRPSGAYRGYKTDAWDGGTHVPFVARWPGHIPAKTVQKDLLCLTDMLATFASVTQASLPEWAGEDSFNQLPAMLSKSAAPARTSLITHSYTGIYSIRDGDWKAVFDTEGSGGHRGITPEWQPIVHGIPEDPGSGGVGQLYNLAKDPYEKQNLWKEHPEVVERLQKLFRQYWGSGRSRPAGNS